jgi:hypothetical protein
MWQLLASSSSLLFQMCGDVSALASVYQHLMSNGRPIIFPHLSELRFSGCDNIDMDKLSSFVACIVDPSIAPSFNLFELSYCMVSLEGVKKLATAFVNALSESSTCKRKKLTVAFRGVVEDDWKSDASMMSLMKGKWENVNVEVS